VAIEFFNNGAHRCVCFADLTEEGDVQANQFIIVDDDKGILLDPGGNKLFAKMMLELPRYMPPQKLQYIFLSHQDPDVGAGLNGYLLVTDAQVCVSAIWERFIPSFSSKSIAGDRLIVIPDQGMKLKLGNAELLIVPAHFLHSPGNFHLYDPISKTLFSGDLGSSLFPSKSAVYPWVTDFHAHIKYMNDFHRRYMASNKACLKWTTMVRSLDIEHIVPQHGAMFEGKTMVNRLIEWIANLQCGVDLL
jgi:flavorubredoxin